MLCLVQKSQTQNKEKYQLAISYPYQSKGYAKLKSDARHNVIDVELVFACSS